MASKTSSSKTSSSRSKSNKNSPPAKSTASKSTSSGGGSSSKKDTKKSPQQPSAAITSRSKTVTSNSNQSRQNQSTARKDRTKSGSTGSPENTSKTGSNAAAAKSSGASKSPNKISSAVAANSRGAKKEAPSRRERRSPSPPKLTISAPHLVDDDDQDSRSSSSSSSPPPPPVTKTIPATPQPPPQDLQSWCEVPSIAHFCSLFRQAFDLLEFDIQELEESFLLMGTEDDTSQLVLRLVIKLLKGCSRTFTNNINEDNYNTYLRRLFLSKREEAEEENLEFHFECRSLLDDGIDFADLSLRHRVSIVHQLCEFRMEAEDVFEKVKNLDAGSLRVEPLGRDSDNVTYWYFYGTRLYKETPPAKEEKVEDKGAKKKKEKEKEKKRKKKDKKEKKKKKKRSHRDSADTSGDEDEATETRSYWSVACLTLEDWEGLCDRYKKSKKKCDRELYETLAESFLPEIVKMFAEREREEKRRLMMMQPKRASSRIERKKQEQEERDRILAIKLEEERQLEEEYDEKVRLEHVKEEEEEREISREERRQQREAMKELRAKKAAEKEVEKEFSGDVLRQRQEQREAVTTAERLARNLKRSRFGSSDDEEEEEAYVPPPSLRKADEDSSNDSADSNYEPKVASKKQQLLQNKQDQARSSFANALLKAGTKSTKDSTLDKPIRKTPGLLLETAGRSLLQKSAATTAAKNLLSGMGTAGGVGGGGLGGGGNSLFDATVAKGVGGTKAKLSFGLYGGHLPVDHGSYTKATGSDSDADSLGSSSMSSVQPVKKVFTNWGGEFFKKNLDYRANTNKILEKMNLGSATKSAGGAASSSTNGGGDSSSTSSSTSSLLTFVPGERFKALLGSPMSSATQAAKRPFGDTGSTSGDSKKLKPNSFLNSYM